MAERLPICREIRQRIEDSDGYWRPYHEAMDEEEAFLEGDRYENDHGAYNRDRRLVQIRGQEVQDTIRHVAAKATEKPRSLESRPIDQVDDGDTGEIAISLVEWELGNPWKGFNREYYSAIVSAREKRLGVVTMDWDPDCGPFGEIIYSFTDPRRVRWDPAWHPHHPLCEWFHCEKRLPLEVAQKRFKATWLQADKDSISKGELGRGVPLLQGSIDRLPGAAYKDNKVTVWYHWLKNDKTQKDKPREGDDVPLDPEQRYLVCLGECGYRSETQGILRQQAKLEDELPEAMPQSCPQCGGDLERIDAKAEDQYTLAYSKGRRLVIMAPFCQHPKDDKPLYDGKWPIPTARSYPALFITCYVKPGKPMGPCDTTLMWDQQIASDHLRTMAVQRIFEHRNYYVMPRTGIYNAEGKRFEFRDDDENVMFRDAADAQFGSLEVDRIEGTGLDPQFMAAFQITQTALTAYRGMNDQGPIEERSKSKSGVAMQTENAIGEVPVADFKRRCSEELSMFAGVVWDYIRATYTPERLSRLRIDGIDILANLSGDDLPNFDFVIADTPDFTGLEKDRTEALNQLIQAAMNPATAPFVDLIAEVNNFPRSIMRKFQKRQEEMRMEQQMQEAQMMEQEMMLAESGGGVGGTGRGNGEGTSSPGNPPPSNAGQNGGGMVPSSVGMG